MGFVFAKDLKKECVTYERTLEFYQLGAIRGLLNHHMYIQQRLTVHSQMLDQEDRSNYISVTLLIHCGS
jgi:hypothetical protein